MDNLCIQIIIETLVVFVAVFLFNYIFFVRKNKKLKEDEMPLELIYLSNLYGIDPKKLKHRKFQYTYSLINSFIITITYLAVIYLIKSMIMKVIIGIVLLILLIIICYGLLGRYYLYQQSKQDKKSSKEQKSKKVEETNKQQESNKVKKSNQVKSNKSNN